jgi:hypothetical protein
MRYQRKTTRKVSRYHQEFMAAYYAARQADEQAREDAVGIYGPGSTEWADYPHDQMMTFKKWLIAMAGQRANDPEPQEAPPWPESQQSESQRAPTSVTSASAGSLNSPVNSTSTTRERAA